MAAAQGKSTQQVLTAISGYSGLSIQAMCNRLLGVSDTHYSLQVALNVGAGRTPYALNTQDALQKNIGYSGPKKSIQDAILYAYANSITMHKIVTGS